MEDENAGAVEIEGIVFSQPSRGVVRRAAFYDTILVVGTPTTFSSRVEFYRSLGVDARLFPLRPSETPFLLALLGLLGWVEKKREEGLRVLVEIEAGQAVIPAAFLMLHGRGVFEAVYSVRSRGFRLYAPLQARLLYLLWVLREENIPISELAERYYRSIFTGIDLYYSLMLEHAVEHFYHLYRFIPLRLSRIYEDIVRPRAAGILTNEEKIIVTIASILSHSSLLAVRNVALEKNGSNLHIYVGCATLLHSDGCWPEISQSQGYYNAIARLVGARKTVFHVMDPEEVACLSYRDVYGEGCEMLGETGARY